MRSSAAQLQKQYREQISAQKQRTEKQNLRTLRWALSTTDADPKAIEELLRVYEKRLRGQHDETA